MNCDNQKHSQPHLMFSLSCSRELALDLSAFKLSFLIKQIVKRICQSQSAIIRLSGGDEKTKKRKVGLRHVVTLTEGFRFETCLDKKRRQRRDEVINRCSFRRFY